MFAYLVRRLFYSFLVILGVLGVLYVLFFRLASPDDIARRALGPKAPQAVIEQWKVSHGYAQPLMPGPGHWTENLFVDHYRRMLTFDFGRSDFDNRVIMDRLIEGAGPSLTLTVPLFLMGLVLGVSFALIVALLRDTYVDRLSLVAAVVSLSIPSLLFIIGGQYLFSGLLRWFPVSGFDPDWTERPRFLALPLLIGLLDGLGSSIRYYRTLFLEEVNRDYVRTARAKGAGDLRVLFGHVLRNVLIPILTNTVVSIPFLFMGSLLLESSFSIPGLGSLTVDAIMNNDFNTLRAIVFIGAVLFVAAQIFTDLCYTWVDPRVRLK